MNEFAVWAPRARAVEVEVAGRRLAMESHPDGWFTVADQQAATGDDYAFHLDGGPARPDPRSPWQPEGVHGRSRVVDHRAFPWSDAGWHGAPLGAAVIYELHVGTFSATGTFDGVVEHLDHLVDLGVTAVELMPVAEFPGRRGWGYDGVDLYAAYHGYGGPEGLKRLVDACHAHGLAVVIDAVYNHLGPDGNYLADFAPYFSDRYRTPWGAAINLDGADSDEVRRFVVDNALMWLRDYHVDGLRLDAVQAIVDTSATHILEEIAEAVGTLQAQLGRTLWVIAESDLNDPRLVGDRQAGGYGLDAQWSDDLHHAVHAALTGERHGYYADFGRLDDVATALRQVFVNDGRYSRFRRRRHGRRPSGIPGSRFLGFLQNHDLVGNRAAGERIAALLGPGLLRAGAALVLSAPFVPLLFAGEEWGALTPFPYFSDHTDPELGRAVTDGRRRELAAFGSPAEAVPDPQDEATFVRSRLDWSEPAREPHASLLRWYRELLRLRRSRPELCDGRLDRVRIRVDEEHRCLQMDRGRITVACNLGARRVRAPLPATARRRLLLCSEAAPDLAGAGVELPPESVSIWETL
ncbi:MAG: malto-oligosyltrehalose trehalohydrolase [Chloroflexi bacterium]|nr:MAG: malto-oligosyltrehalose trehalohydrolase [Chloroflexota bacterium]